MAFSDYWRGDRGHEQERDRNRDRDRWRLGGRERGGQRSYGSENYDPREDDYERRGWRRGSDYYGSNPERYGERGYGQGGERRYEGQGYESRERGGYRDEDRGEEFLRGYGSRLGGSYNDRWENAYVGTTTGGPYGQSPESWRRDEFSGGMYEPMRSGSSPWSERQERGGWEGHRSRQGYGSQYGGGMSATHHGEHRGKGPRGYRRPDERIREDVCECLTEDDRLDASNMDVTVKDCEVTLSGTVASREDKRRAEDLAESVFGVKDVSNNLRVASETSRSETTGKQYGQSQTGQTAPGSHH